MISFYDTSRFSKLKEDFVGKSEQVFIGISYNDSLVRFLKMTADRSIGVKSGLANKGITIEGFLPIMLREFVRKAPRVLAALLVGIFRW